MATNRVSPKKGKVVDIPTAPTIGTATAGPGSATVAVTAATIGGPVTTFTALSNPGSITGTGTSPITVSGLTAGTAYTFTVRGSNATGNGEYSSASNSVTPTVETRFDSIATSTVGSGGVTSVTFSSIPSTYKHLQIRYTAATNDGNYNALIIRHNSDTGANYAWHAMYGNGATPSAEYAADATNIRALGTPGTGQSGVFQGAIYDLLDYANPSKFKTSRILNGVDANGSGYAGLSSGLWRSEAAITSITIAPITGGGLLIQNSKFALYGIKG
jgi:hypothetical protein